MNAKAKTKIATTTVGEQIQALETAIESRAAQLQDSTALVEKLTAEHVKGSSFARGHGWVFSGRESLPGELGAARCALDSLQFDQRYALRELEELRAIRDSASDLSEVESDLYLLRADLARVNASAAEMRARAAGFAADLLAAQDALGVAFDAESIAALEGEAAALTAAGEAVAQAQAAVARHARTGVLAAARLVEIAETQRSVQEAIDSLAYRLAAAKLACAKREIAELLPALVALCGAAYEAGCLTRGGHWGGEAQVPDLLALVKAARGGSPVDIRRRDPSPRFSIPGVGKLAPGVPIPRAAACQPPSAGVAWPNLAALLVVHRWGAAAAALLPWWRAALPLLPWRCCRTVRLLLLLVPDRNPSPVRDLPGTLEGCQHVGGQRATPIGSISEFLA